ncbi:hypothetical protein [Laspinema olomoucense]|uniref:Gas vesicle protein n=1 Tax=Laspinema olomoucense D3b TaxID=2953688 RepID=A0ABT2N1B4_9CYAN|nr:MULTISPECIES: hypothetical protein [unclassified Laspinema]MCT7971966.1 hypothetical protein [Laspinema sp. D3d]MCT7976437.1 hypothetical protein [Laspinema sp. D3b]MCT7990015.1 hypothetical protein [Laspinema sp. D3a]MCT7994577.1 hypothetical protein [Laspinema sp. D3c]
MSNRDNFAGGFLLGTILGGIVGGAIGAIVGAKLAEDNKPPENGNRPEPRPRKLKKRQFAEQAGMETARRSLENKIAQLNDAIDDVRQQLSHVNGAVVDENETLSPLTEES